MLAKSREDEAVLSTSRPGIGTTQRTAATNAIGSNASTSNAGISNLLAAEIHRGGP